MSYAESCACGLSAAGGLGACTDSSFLEIFYCAPGATGVWDSWSVLAAGILRSFDSGRGAVFAGGEVCVGESAPGRVGRVALGRSCAVVAIGMWLTFSS